MMTNHTYGLGGLVLALTEGVTNRNISSTLSNSLGGALSHDPFLNMKRRYDEAANGLFVNLAGVFVPFTAEGRTINPRHEIDHFLATGKSLYGHAIGRIVGRCALLSNAGKDYTPQHFMTREEHEAWRASFAPLLASEIETAYNLALWAKHLANKGWPVGGTVRDKLNRFGITNPDALPEDVRTIGDNIQNIYHAIEKHQLAQYPPPDWKSVVV